MSFYKIAKTVSKAFFKGPATLMYPVKVREFKPTTRGHIEINIDNCIFCGMCMRRCPSLAIKVTKDEKQWEIDRMACVACNNCVDVCPKKCLRNEGKYSAPSTGKERDVFKLARVPDNQADSGDSGK